RPAGKVERGLLPGQKMSLDNQYKVGKDNPILIKSGLFFNSDNKFRVEAGFVKPGWRFFVILREKFLPFCPSVFLFLNEE
ncbi:MAG: hypothetical protein ACUVR0_12150, partial [Candidatus Aminicenantales bacterium]